MIEEIKKLYKATQQDPEWKYPTIQKFVEEALLPRIRASAKNGAWNCIFFEYSDMEGFTLDEVDFSMHELIKFLEKEGFEASCAQGTLSISGWAE